MITLLKLNGTFCVSQREVRRETLFRPMGWKFTIFMLSFIFHVHAKLVHLCKRERADFSAASPTAAQINTKRVLDLLITDRQ